MSEKKVLLKDATGPQMRAFAEAYLGMTFRHNEANEKVRASIAEAWQKDEIIVNEPDAQEPLVGSPPRQATAEQAAKSSDKVRIIIQRSEEAGGDEPVPVGVNGKVMLVPRGEPVEIPRPYFEVLQHAVKHVYEQLAEGGINPIPRQVPAYPFQVLA